MTDPVSRETSGTTEPPAAPASARAVFGADRLPLAERYAELLATEGVLRGLIGPREVPRLWERHLVNCAVLSEVIPQGATVCDVGTGAGLPGVVLAIARPDLSVTLVEPLQRRTTFLAEAIAALGLERCAVQRIRAEQLHGTDRYDIVTSRAVAPLSRLLAWSMPLVAPTGALVAMKGSRARAEIEEARDSLHRFGCAEPEVLSLGAGEPTLLDPPTTVVRVVWDRPV